MINLVVMDFNRVSIESYQLSMKDILGAIPEGEAGNMTENEVIENYILSKGHKLSEVHYMYSEDEIEFINH